MSVPSRMAWTLALRLRSYLSAARLRILHPMVCPSSDPLATIPMLPIQPLPCPIIIYGRHNQVRNPSTAIHALHRRCVPLLDWINFSHLPLSFRSDSINDLQVPLLDSLDRAGSFGAVYCGILRNKLTRLYKLRLYKLCRDDYFLINALTSTMTLPCVDATTRILPLALGVGS